MPTREKKPIVAISTPSSVNHACKVLSLKANGRPEAKPSNAMTVMRRFRS